MKPTAKKPIEPSTFHTCYVVALEAGLFPEGTLPPRVRALSRSVKSLWERFNAKRERLDRGYMAVDADLEAYLAAFQLPNIERVRGLLRRYLSEATPLPVRDFAKQPLRVLDFGSGPLSASAGLVAFLEEKGNVPAKIEIVAVDFSGPAIALGTTVLQDAIAARKAKGRLSVSVARLPEKEALAQGHYDFVLAANVLNEILPASRAPTLGRLAGACAQGGFLLVLEPGQDVHSRALSAARDAFLVATSARTFELVAPCPHRRACPLGPDKGRKDWCWFRHNWHPPAFLNALDKASGLDHAELAYSFVLFQNRPAAAKETKPAKDAVLLKTAPHARVVSDDIPMPKDPETRERARSFVARNSVGALDPRNANAILDDEGTKKILLCTSSGVLEGLYAATRQGRKTRGSDMVLKDSQLRAREGSLAARPREEEDAEQPTDIAVRDRKVERKPRAKPSEKPEAKEVPVRHSTQSRLRPGAIGNSSKRLKT